MEEYGLSIFLGTAFGLIARLYMLTVDYRQYPSYPHGFVTHLTFGFIAAALGSVAVPALLEKDFAAVTFLALAAQQFREVRNMERETLTRLEEEELIPRGIDYVEGIAKVFEARNYLVMATALVTSAANQFVNWPLAIFIGTLAIFLATRLKRGKVIGNIAEVLPAKVYFKNSLLFVDDIDFMNVGLKAAREKIEKEALGVLIKPKDDNARATLHSRGQRQAIAHISAAVLGTKKEVDTPEFTPLVRKHIDTGKIALYIVPAEPDMECLIEVVKRVPILESAQRAPLKTKAGRIAAD